MLSFLIPNLRYERQLAGPSASRRKSSTTPTEFPQLTRSKTVPYNKEVCFFCDNPPRYRQSLHNASTFSAGESLRTAVILSGNEKLLVKLNTAIPSGDARAIDIKYHKCCWASNVTNVLRKAESTSSSSTNSPYQIAAKIEFLSMTQMELADGKIISMSDLQTAFENILDANNVSDAACSRKALKQLLLSEIPEIEFHKAKRVNESDRVSMKKTRDAAIQLVEDQCDDTDSDIKTLFDAAAILRRSINKCQRWKFTGSFKDLSEENVPEELYSFFRWLTHDQNSLSSAKKSDEVHKRAMSLAQSTVSMCLTDRQAKNKKSDTLRFTHQMPQQLAVGLTVHQAIRNKGLIRMLHGLGMSVDYDRILRVENQIASSVLKRVAENNGVYLPPDIVKGKHVFFAIDNIDFAEDTTDGKRTFHGTVVSIYQKAEPGDKIPELELQAPDHSPSIKEIPDSLTNLLDCPAPPPKPVGPVYPQFGLFCEDELPIRVRMQDFAWLLVRSVPKALSDRPQTQDSQPSSTCTNVPVWSAYNSLISDVMPVTRVGIPPLIAAPAHEWQTLLTVLMQAQDIKTKIIGQSRKTVISLDLGLYQPAKKLQTAREDLHNIILRPGELHIVMAQLRAIGKFIENSGLDMSWIESELYGPATVKQIIEGNHVKRGETAHMITLQALSVLYLEAFNQQQDQALLTDFQQLSKLLGDTCAHSSKEKVRLEHEKLVQAIESMQVPEKIKAFDKSKENIPLFCVMRQYMRMVTEMMVFIRAVRTGDWDRHLESLEAFTKYFFAHDMLNYARMIPVYLAEMHKLQDSNPDIYREFQQGNWVVNKNPNVAFCATGADHALEHVNRSMKVAGGLVGITLNPKARMKYFLIAPELARLADQAKQMAGTSTTTPTHHHSMSNAARLRQDKNVEQLIITLRSFTNPFLEDSSDLYNLVTKVVLPDKVKNDLCQQSSIGRKLLGDFVKERIQSCKFSIWSTMKKRKLLTWKSTGKTLRVVADEKVIELKEDRSLFARMMVVCKSRPEIHIKEAIGEYEFSIVPRSMFAADGTMLHCSSKSALMEILELAGVSSSCGNHVEDVTHAAAAIPMKVCIVDASPR